MTHTIYSDIELLEGLSLSDNNAINEIYRLYQSMLTKWIVSRGGDEMDAYDVFQDGVMVLYEKSKDPEFCLTCKLSTYLFAVCKRLWFKKTEGRANTTALHENMDDEDGEIGDEHYQNDIDQHLEKEAHFKILEQALEQLGQPCEGLLKAFYIEDKTMQEIAATFNYTNAENAKTQKYKCLTRLKKIFFSNKR